MGENVLKGQVKDFKKGSDRSLRDMATPTLFDRPDIMSTVYTAAPVEAGGVAKGDRLEAHAAADGHSVLLVKGHVTVGRIEGDGAKSLLDAALSLALTKFLRDSPKGSLFPMRTSRLSRWIGR